VLIFTNDVREEIEAKNEALPDVSASGRAC
jgi:hypothetical protein